MILLGLIAACTPLLSVNPFDKPSFDIPVTSINLSSSEISLPVGDTKTLTATVLPSNATDKTVNGLIGDFTSLKALYPELEFGFAYDEYKYSISDVYSITPHVAATPDSSGNVSANLSELKSNTQYFYRVYVKAGGEYYYSKYYSVFKTLIL